MVYCGKASQGCQGCRSRRIKCDKVRPECSQCIRVGKKCPGYRDQLSLMFRDESTKVIQKAHAQWGTPESALQASAPGGSARSTVRSASGSSSSSSSSSATSSRGGRIGLSSTPQTSPIVKREAAPARLQRSIDPNLDERGLQFYISRYLLDQPDGPRTSEELATYCSGTDAMQNIVIAVGLAGLSNLRGDRNLNLYAREKYISALRHTGQLVLSSQAQRDRVGFGLGVKSVVTLALFEVVNRKGSVVSADTARTHIQGAIALFKAGLPFPNAPKGGAKGALQLLFTLFIPSQMTDMFLPSAFFEVLNHCKELLEGSPEVISVEVALATADVVRLSSALHKTAYADGREPISAVLQELLALQDKFDRMEDFLRDAYPFREHQGSEHPPSALFRGRWHTYGEIWAARIWNHYRWARIVLSEMVVRSMVDYPVSGRRFFSAAHCARTLATIQRMAEDTLVSTPAHWHHPVLDKVAARKLGAPGQGGSGAAGVPTLMWHLKIAGCATGVSQELWDWSYAVMQVVWRDMGMQHAIAIADVMEKERAALGTDTRTAHTPQVKVEVEELADDIQWLESRVA